MSLAFAGLALERPAALLALAVPVGLWWLARVRPEPPSRATGAFSLWSAFGERPVERGARARRALPLAVRLALLALALGVFAAAGPRRAAAGEPRVFVALVDASPSTSLALADGRPRLAAALDAALAWLARAGRPGDRVTWRSTARAPLELPLGTPPPAEWLAAPPFFAREPDFAREDRAGTLWITDRAAREPAAAACFASGGPSVPGPVAWNGRERVDWDGTRLVEFADALASRPVAIVAGANALPDELADLLGLWARERGCALDARAPDPALVLEAAPAGATSASVAGRDGWSARGIALDAGLDPAGASDPLAERWLEEERAGGARRTLVAAAPGRVRIAWTSLASLAGDPAVFALSWSRLFDRLVLPPPGIVPLAERADAGEARSITPASDDPRASSRADATPEAVLALAAAACALGAALAAARRG